MTIWKTAENLSTCLCAQFEIDCGKALCFCGVVPGGEVALEYMGDCGEECGMAWVQVTGTYPASGVGIPNITPSNCWLGLGVDVQVGVARCMPVGDERGGPPTLAQLQEAAEQQAQDMETVRKAVLCCQTEDLIVGRMTPFGPDGGVYGFAVEINYLVT